MDEEKKEVIEVEKVENTENIKTEKQKEDKKGFCIASLVLGIVTLIFFCIWYISIPCGILAIIFGILGIKSTGKGMAVAGLTTGTIGLVISIIILVLVTVGIMAGADMLSNMDLNVIDSYEGYNFNVEI